MDKITVGLVGQRPDLAALCRGALANLPESEWTLLERPPGAEAPEASLVVWDLPAGGTMPDLDGLPASCQNVFLVHESCLESLCRRLPIAAAANILVEPAPLDETREFLARVFRRHLEAIRLPDPRRSDRDDLLQSLLLAGLKLNEFRGERGHFFRRALRDLSGPLTALGGYCGLLLDQQLGPLNEAQLDVLRHMQDGAERLSSLLSAMLHLSHGMLDPAEVRMTPGDITVALDRAVAEVLPGAEAREIEIRLDVAQPSCVLLLDLGLLHRVLACLLGNASRFTPRCGAVEVRGYPVLFREPDGNWPTGPGASEPSNGRASRDGYRIDIRDFGLPIPPESLPGVFALSADCRGGFDRSEGGLELAMCKMILEAHKGELCVESGESGTVFSVILPSRDAGAAVIEQGSEHATAEAT